MIYLANSDIRDESLAGIPFFCKFGCFPELARIDLQHTRIGDLGIRYLSSIKFLMGLDLTDTRITDKCAVDLGRMQHIDTLTLVNTSVNDRALEALARSRSLIYLNLSGTKITDEGLKHLSHTGIRFLYLADTAVSDSGVAPLLANGSSIESVDVTGTRCTEALLKLKSTTRVEGLGKRKG